ncbi:MAG: ABC transporter ATP-binding protein [Lentisphaerae bacterium]|nr:ABC transporter ATP-binding protein [Lentisphaerota bacterium]
MISVRNVYKRYGRTVALDGLSFEVEEGTMFGLLGPNGAGKTTLISCLCGMVHPDQGELCIQGLADLTQIDVRSCLGVVPQSIALYEELSALGNLRFFGRLFGLSGAQLEERVEACLAISLLKDRAKDSVATYSGGMKRRLNLACSLLHDPKVILLDEPTVGVDPQSRNLIFDTIENMKAQGKTLIYTTHYMEEAQRMCDRVAIMDAGKILALDSVPNLIAQYGGAARVEACLTDGVVDKDQILSRLDNETACVVDQTLRFDSCNPLAELTGLYNAGIQLSSLKMEAADLEDVFLNLTGRTLRDT